MTPAVWIPALGAVVAALVAGTAAIYQSRRTLTAQRNLEHEKLRASERAVELTQERAERAQEQALAQSDRREQVLPFLDCLNKAINASYAAAYLPEHFPKIGSRIPQIRQFSDAELRKWYAAVEEMSRRRIRLLLAIDESDLDRVVDQLVGLTEQMSAIVEARHKLWFGEASRGDLWEAQREYVRIDYGLMLDIRSAVLSRPTGHSRPDSSGDRVELARRLSLSLEKSSAISVPYGSVKDFTWVCIWEIDAREDWLDYVEAMNQGTLDEFTQSLGNVLRSIRERGRSIESNLFRFGGDGADVQVYCLYAKFPDETSMKEFLDQTTAELRKEFPIAWSSFRQPVELSHGVRGEERPADAP
ncbi:hypothetical protein [Lentzea sp. HUAS12]|uniref:hypothetical protein n=1 Tax=Lentzea sp. HUAS12 TaxID=2951806 RepID=UPI00209D56EF|nr:hypothetical protein [Lentzea sp. HUAS12]USX51949.1 hypothetical protein ND450_42595 [Lentzea sp. HUAS12]